MYSKRNFVDLISLFYETASDSARWLALSWKTCKAVLIFAILVSSVVAYGCGGGSVGISSAPPPPVVPAITTQPMSQTVTAGQTATFTVAATGTAPLSYQWSKNGSAIAGATSASYTTPATTTADSGSSFTVTVSNAAGSTTSLPVTLTVNAAAIAPTITSQPASQTVVAGQTATFTVAATGTAPLSYQWQVAQNSSWSNIPGAASSSYTTPSTTTADSGKGFQVVIANAAGSVTSVPATLIVNPVPNPVPTVSSLSPSSATAGGAAFTLTVNGTNYIASSAVYWNGAALPTTFVSAAQLTASVSAAQIATAGNYPVTVVNPAPGGGTSNAVNFTVNLAPTITSQPASQTVVAGQTATFTVAATGTAPLSYQWSKNGSAIAGATSASYTTPATTTADSGSSFTVTVSNAVGSTTSVPATLIVNPVPNPVPTVSSLSPSSATAGGAAFTLTVNGTNYIASSAVYWNGAALPTTFVNAAQLTASVAAAQIATAGNYPVTVVNPAPDGGTSNAVNFTVNPAPAVPVIKRVKQNTFCARDGCLFQETIVGSGFYAGDTLIIADEAGRTQALVLNNVTTDAQGNQVAAISTIIDTPRYNPGWFRYTITNQGGISNAGYFNFLGNQNTLALSAANAEQLDQADPNTPNANGYPSGAVYSFLLADGSAAGKFAVGGNTTGIAVDGGTGGTNLILVISNRVVAIYDSTGRQVSGMTDAASDLFMSVAAKNHYGCATADQANSLTCGDLTQPIPVPITINIGTTPMNIAMGMVNNQLTAAVLNVGDGTLAWTPVPQMTAPQSVALPGFTRIANIQNPVTGGWALAMFNSGVAAVLSRYDRSVWFVNLATGAVSGPYALSADPFGEIASGAQTLFGDPFRIAADDVHNALVIALADENGLSGGTRFVKMDEATGAAAPLQSFSTLLTVGLAVTQDGSRIVDCMRNHCEFKPNN